VLPGERSAGVLLAQLSRQYRCDTAYLADLDAIVSRQPQPSVWRELAAVVGHLWLDAGICTAAALADLRLPHNVTPIVGSETAVQLDSLLQLSATTDIIFSLDLRQGTPITA
ncbi:MAG: hypothetical protein ACKPJD_27635, partial [Planctomycetaceae bacterium]